MVPDIDKSAWYVFQDKANNYWFGSDGHGVYRWDGRTITQFTKKDGLCADQIRAIHQHKSGVMVFTTFAGICTFDGKTFTKLTPVECAPGEGWKLGPDDLWLQWFKGMGVNEGPFRYDGTTLYHLKFPTHRLDVEESKQPRGWSSYDVYSIFRDSRGHVWIGTSNFGVCRFDGTTLEWLYEEHLTMTPQGGSFGIRSTVEDKEGAIWVCNTRYRYRPAPSDAPARTDEYRDLKYTREAGITSFKAPDGDDHVYFMSAVKDAKGDLWMATYGMGVFRYDGARVTHYPVRDAGEDITVFGITRDNRGDLWLGTHEHGAFKFNGTGFERVKF